MAKNSAQEAVQAWHNKGVPEHSDAVVTPGVAESAAAELRTLSNGAVVVEASQLVTGVQGK